MLRTDPQVAEYVLELRLTSKFLTFSAKKAEREVVKKKKKVLVYLKKGEREFAEIHANDAIRKHGEYLRYLTLAARVDGLRSKVECMQLTNTIVKTLSSISKGFESSLKTMDPIAVATMVEKFDYVFLEMGAMENVMDDSLQTMETTTIPSRNIDNLIDEVTEELSMDNEEILLPSVPSTTIEVSTQQSTISTPDKDVILL